MRGNKNKRKANKQTDREDETDKRTDGRTDRRKGRQLVTERSSSDNCREEAGEKERAGGKVIGVSQVTIYLFSLSLQPHQSQRAAYKYKYEYKNILKFTHAQPSQLVDDT